MAEAIPSVIACRDGVTPLGYDDRQRETIKSKKHVNIGHIYERYYRLRPGICYRVPQGYSEVDIL
jgi:hypothetical protein